MARKGGLIGAPLRSGFLATIYAVLEAERLLRRAVTIVRETSATSSSQNLMVQSGCIIGNLSEVRNKLSSHKSVHTVSIAAGGGLSYHS